MTTRLTSVVIDAAEPAVLARWWSDALGWPITYEAPDEVVVEPEGNEGAAAVPALVFGATDDPKLVKNRVHLDLASDSAEHQAEQVRSLVAAGATERDIGQTDVPWVVLADPEGNEFCVLEARQRHQGRGPLASIVVDATDPASLGAYWAVAAGWPIAFAHDRVVSLHNPSGVLPDVDFVRVPEAKTVKNRVHLDVAPFAGDDQAADIEALLGIGARHADVGQGPEVTWVVLADPEGNEHCVLSPR